jgi:hypothetical protein
MLYLFELPTCRGSPRCRSVRSSATITCAAVMSASPRRITQDTARKFVGNANPTNFHEDPTSESRFLVRDPLDEIGGRRPRA